MAVAIWEERPTPEALLEDRLVRGWRPTPTFLATGAEVQGFASRVPEDEWRWTPES